jgi:hypothetical protein
MDFEDDDLTPEEMILEDIQEWCEVHLLDGQPWKEYFDQFDQKSSHKKMTELMDIYWRDHIFPVDKYNI